MPYLPPPIEKLAMPDTANTYKIAEIIFLTMSAAAGYPAQERDWDVVVVQWQISKENYPMVTAAISAANRIENAFSIRPIVEIIKN